MDKYYQILGKVLSSGKMQSNKKGNIRYLLNEQLTLLPADLLDIFEGAYHSAEEVKKRVTTVYEGRTKRGKIQGGRNQLVGLLRLYPCEQLPNLF